MPRRSPASRSTRRGRRRLTVRAPRGRPRSPSPKSIPKWARCGRRASCAGAACGCRPRACARSGSRTGSPPATSGCCRAGARDVREGRALGIAARAAAAHAGQPAADQQRRCRRVGQRREQLISAAARVIGAKGYERASLQEICAAAGILPGSLYYHFKSKEDLFIKVHAEGFRQLNEAVDRAVAAESDPWRRLEAACAAHLELLVASDDVSLVAGTSLFHLAEPRAAAPPQPRPHRLRGALSRHDRRAAAAARGRPDAAAAHALRRAQLDHGSGTSRGARRPAEIARHLVHTVMRQSLDLSPSAHRRAWQRPESRLNWRGEAGLAGSRRRAAPRRRPPAARPGSAAALTRRSSPSGSSTGRRSRRIGCCSRSAMRRAAGAA